MSLPRSRLAALVAGIPVSPVGPSCFPQRSQLGYLLGPPVFGSHADSPRFLPAGLFSPQRPPIVSSPPLGLPSSSPVSGGPTRALEILEVPSCGWVGPLVLLHYFPD